MVTATKPRPMSREDAGRIAARARWGEPRVIRLDSLTPEQARLVRALVEAARSAPADANTEPQAA
jgi:hypothetical protein